MCYPRPTKSELQVAELGIKPAQCSPGDLGLTVILECSLCSSRPPALLGWSLWDFSLMFYINPYFVWFRLHIFILPRASRQGSHKSTKEPGNKCSTLSFWEGGVSTFKSKKFELSNLLTLIKTNLTSWGQMGPHPITPCRGSIGKADPKPHRHSPRSLGASRASV